MGKTFTKLLVISGATATGKTNLASYLAKKFNGVLISADSRMVYKYMDIGTGKDTEKYGKILGYDLVRPDEEFSVSQYVKFANDAVKNINNQKKLPILVGGTGFYIKAVVDGIETIDIKPNKSLREKYKNKNANELFAILMKSYPAEAIKLNSSDSKNPRRLIRLLEILKAGKNPEKDIEKMKFDDVLMIGLKCDFEEIKKRIVKRVDERIKEGFDDEIKWLKRKDYFRYAPSRTIGYKEYPDIYAWKNEEIKYAKRQMTWFKKDKRIVWFNISDENFNKDVENLVQRWYS